jgi:thiol-disulfide isomerase/thioredoxin
MKVIKNIAALLISLLLFNSCAATESDGIVRVSGKIKNPIPQGEIILEKFEVGQMVTVNTVRAKEDSTFSIDVKVTEPGFYRLNVYGQQFDMLVLDKEDITVEADGQGGQFIESKGSQDLEYLTEVLDYMGAYSEVVRDFNQRYSAAQQSGDDLKVEELTNEGLGLEALKVKKLKKMAWKMDGSIVPLLITDYFPNKADEYPFLDSLGKKLNKEIPNSTQVTLFVENIELIKPAVSIGDFAPEISLPKPNGEMASLSDLKGKYVLLDFWAGWCGPCRRENPNVVAMYNKYNADGFEVFSVSLDRTKDQWVNAIAADGLIWPTHVSDLSYFQSQAAIDYKVNAIPFALLLDPDGKVIGKNLRGRALQDKLAQIFKK